MNSRFLKRTGLAVAALAVAFASGCATVGHQPLADAATKQIDDSVVYVGVRQSEIMPTIDVSVGGAGFGLIGAMVDSGINQSRTEDAEAMIQPLRDALIDYDFDGRMEQVTRSTLQHVDWLKPTSVGVLKGDLNQAYKQKLSGANTDVVVFITTDYFLSPDFRKLTMTARTTVFPVGFDMDTYRQSGRHPAPGEEVLIEHAMYFNDYSVEVVARGIKGDASAMVSAWAANDAALAREALEIGKKHIATMAAFDLMQTKGAAIKTDIGIADIAPGQTRAIQLGEDELHVYRQPNGSLTSRTAVEL